MYPIPHAYNIAPDKIIKVVDITICMYQVTWQVMLTNYLSAQNHMQPICHSERCPLIGVLNLVCMGDQGISHTFATLVTAPSCPAS
jgi:hypothetical protein